MSYVGEAGFELFVPVEFTLGVYEALLQAGALAHAGYYALDSLRIEKGYRAWGRELTPDITPFEAGLSFAVDFDKPGGFIGRDALLALKGQPLHQRIAQFSLTDTMPQLWGGELLLRDGVPVGKVMSAAHGHSIGRPVTLCRIEESTQAIDRAYLSEGAFEIDLAGVRFTAKWHAKPPI
jgi:4-methylaminobutanoate oxidase (formaldehyde-forming)